MLVRTFVSPVEDISCVKWKLSSTSTVETFDICNNPINLFAFVGGLHQLYMCATWGSPSHLLQSRGLQAEGAVLVGAAAVAMEVETAGAETAAEEVETAAMEVETVTKAETVALEVEMVGMAVKAPQ